MGFSPDKYRKFAACCLVALSIVLVVFTGGCGDKKALDQAQTEIAKLQKENGEQKSKIDLLEKDNAKMNEDIKKNIEEIGALKRRLTDAGVATTPEEGAFDICKENLKKIAMAIRLYAADNNKLVPKKLNIISPNPNYLEFIPTCPSVTKDTYTDGYEVSKDKKTYTVYCSGKNHENVSVKENYPQYSSVKGISVEREQKGQKNEDDED
ncbi:MAG: hypothetical protein RDV48_12240 [Candidatus Eremiobacteraeota bacterium]|nr:hypothetical protein [Candidatus Eremiobacteraeota bacterium]